MILLNKLRHIFLKFNIKMNKFVLSEKNYFLIPDMLKRASEKKTSSVDIFVVPEQRMLLKKEWNFIMDILLFYEKYFQIYL